MDGLNIPIIVTLPKNLQKISQAHSALGSNPYAFPSHRKEEKACLPYSLHGCLWLIPVIVLFLCHMKNLYFEGHILWGIREWEVIFLRGTCWKKVNLCTVTSAFTADNVWIADMLRCNGESQLLGAICGSQCKIIQPSEVKAEADLFEFFLLQLGKDFLRKITGELIDFNSTFLPYFFFVLTKLLYEMIWFFCST